MSSFIPCPCLCPCPNHHPFFCDRRGGRLAQAPLQKTDLVSCRHGRVARGATRPRADRGRPSCRNPAESQDRHDCLSHLGGEFYSVTCWQLPPPVMDTLHTAHRKRSPDGSDMRPLRKGGSQTLRQTLLCLLRTPQAALQSQSWPVARELPAEFAKTYKSFRKGNPERTCERPGRAGAAQREARGEHPFPKGWPQHQPTKLSCPP